MSFPTIHGELYLECIAYESVRFPGYAELIRTFVTRQVLPVAMDLKSVIHSTAAEYGYQLRCKQEESILAFTGGMDVFVSLPTGYGKSLCYTLLSPIYDKIRKVDRKSIVLVVSPLVALMQDQVGRITSKGISATCLADESNRRGVKNGEYQVAFVSPETLSFPEWRNMLSSDTYSENLIGFIIDEAHCIKKW